MIEQVPETRGHDHLARAGLDLLELQGPCDRVGDEDCVEAGRQGRVDVGLRGVPHHPRAHGVELEGGHDLVVVAMCFSGTISTCWK